MQHPTLPGAKTMTLHPTHLCPPVNLVECLNGEELVLSLVVDCTIQLAAHHDVNVLVIIELPLAVPSVHMNSLRQGTADCCYNWFHSLQHS